MKFKIDKGVTADVHDLGFTYWYREADDGSNQDAFFHLGGIDGLFHRERGPAIIYSNGLRVWCKDGVSHREGAPAVFLADGEKLWCLNGENLDEKIYWETIKNEL